MKYLKTHEGLFDFLKKKEKHIYCQYKDGDYVVCLKTSESDSRYVKLKDYVENNAGQIYHIANEDLNEISPFIWVKYHKIEESFCLRLKFKEYELRYATPEEIEKYKIEDDLIKYNL